MKLPKLLAKGGEYERTIGPESQEFIINAFGNAEPFVYAPLADRLKMTLWSCNTGI